MQNDKGLYGMSANDEQEWLSKLIGILREATERDDSLRQKYQIGEKFRFVRDRLHALLESVEKELSSKEIREKKFEPVNKAEDEIFVYIHLYNAQGPLFRTWKNIITPKAFFDFSVNRPIYKEKAHIEEFIKAKINKAQHAYLTIAVKGERVLPATDGALKDTMGHSLIKVKEGSLFYEKLVSFVHNEQEYVLTEEGEFKKILDL